MRKLNSEVTAYPLVWPEGWERTPPELRDRGDRFKTYETQYRQVPGGQGYSHKVSRTTTLDKARKQMAAELGRLGAKDVILSTNLKLRNDGEPYAGEATKAMPDPGIAVYFQYRGKPMVMAVDRYQNIAANMRSLGLAIEGMRQLERHGGGAMMERAFTGFAALPPPGGASARHWRVVLGFAFDERVEADHVKQRYRALAAERHPDMGGGSEGAMAELNAAKDEALRAVGG